MTVRYYLVPYVRDGWVLPPAQAALLGEEPKPHRTVALNVDAPNFKNWAEIEALGNMALVKVNASAAVLTQLNAAYQRLPDPDTLLSSLSGPARQKISDTLETMGYTVQEIAEKLPNPIGTYTMRQVMNFMISKRRKVRYDAATDSLIFDGRETSGGTIDALDSRVT